jgi:hypothetical protein
MRYEETSGRNVMKGEGEWHGERERERRTTLRGRGDRRKIVLWTIGHKTQWLNYQLLRSCVEVDWYHADDHAAMLKLSCDGISSLLWHSHCGLSLLRHPYINKIGWATSPAQNQREYHKLPCGWILITNEIWQHPIVKILIIQKIFTTIPSLHNDIQRHK